MFMYSMHMTCCNPAMASAIKAVSLLSRHYWRSSPMMRSCKPCQTWSPSMKHDTRACCMQCTMRVSLHPSHYFILRLHILTLSTLSSVICTLGVHSMNFTEWAAYLLASPPWWYHSRPVHSQQPAGYSQSLLHLQCLYRKNTRVPLYNWGEPHTSNVHSYHGGTYVLLILRLLLISCHCITLIPGNYRQHAVVR